jgi:hypothetical protein
MATLIEDPAATAVTGQPPSETIGIVSEAAILREIPVCRKTLKTWRDSGKIPYVRIGRRVLYHRGAVRSALLRLQRGDNA